MSTKISVTEMRMLHWMYDKAIRNKVRNKDILITIGVNLIEE